VKHRHVPPCGGPHGGANNVFKTGGVVHPWGARRAVSSAARSLDGGAGRSTSLLPMDWRLI
jgi:hypothetical protein